MAGPTTDEERGIYRQSPVPKRLVARTRTSVIRTESAEHAGYVYCPIRWIVAVVVTGALVLAEYERGLQYNPSTILRPIDRAPNPFSGFAVLVVVLPVVAAIVAWAAFASKRKWRVIGSVVVVVAAIMLVQVDQAPDESGVALMAAQALLVLSFLPPFVPRRLTQAKRRVVARPRRHRRASRASTFR